MSTSTPDSSDPTAHRVPTVVATGGVASTASPGDGPLKPEAFISATLDHLLIKTQDAIKIITSFHVPNTRKAFYIQLAIIIASFLVTFFAGIQIDEHSGFTEWITLFLSGTVTALTSLQNWLKSQQLAAEQEAAIGRFHRLKDEIEFRRSLKGLAVTVSALETLHAQYKAIWDALNQHHYDVNTRRTGRQTE